VPPSRGRAWVRGTLTLLGLGLIVLALARPAYDPKPRKVSRTGRDVVFVIDISRSMLAQDIRPNRLERAKLAVRDVLDVVEGDRIGVVAFAGTAAIKCPLTTDYAFARMALDDLSPDSILRGGTAIGSAIRTATELLAPEKDEAADQGRHRDIFLFTDGEDHETDPVEAAKDAAAKNIRIVTIGLGSESSGAPVPAPELSGPGTPPSRGGYIEYEGQRVQSKLNPDSLRSIAEAGAPGGIFLNVGTGNIELDRVYQKLMQDAQRSKLEDTEAVKYTEAFQLLLAAAMAMLVMEPLLGWRRRGR
jgi:Ca-activated chloride channel family protein